ncbi:DEAD/DEAH box helicase family protein [Klebsiella pneumoniae]|uniref:DEAD/DEAH box helicase family protein n=1 Tax=Klebsiella pneumoniae TaxID=573 RepID=UPI001F4FD7E9|nr:DEAD/DEAH box helicase family protein [Klebsiella pneumoniae]
MNTSAVFESAGLSLRKVQQDYIEAAAGALTQDHKVALISAETGVGKTLGYLVPALLILLKNPEAKFVIATNSHALMGFVNGMVASHLLCHSGTINRHSLNGALLS